MAKSHLPIAAASADEPDKPSLLPIFAAPGFAIAGQIVRRCVKSVSFLSPVTVSAPTPEAIAGRFPSQLKSSAHG